jgi:carboxymethylenebutenolidase
MTHLTTRIPSHDGKSFGAYLAIAANPAAPTLVVIQEIFGVNAGMRKMCDSWAQAGYNAICPDIFWRQKPEVELTDKTQGEWDQAIALMNGFDVDLGIKDLISTMTYMRAQPGANKKAGTIGFCLGGKLAFLMAVRSDADCNVSYYGVGLDGMLGDVPKITKPLLVHFAALDKYTPPEKVKLIQAAYAQNKTITSYVYPGVDHAFARIDGVNFNEGAATLANNRSREFLAQGLK